MNKLKIKLVENNDELNQVFNIRRDVFIKGQNVPEKLEMDGLDKETDQFIVLLDNKPIGCARIKSNEYAKLERIAILKPFRNNGYGSKLTNFLINYCEKQKISHIYLHSQIYIADFYKKHGFIEIGKPFYEAGIKHIKMIYK